MHTFCDDTSYPNALILIPARLADETQLDALIVPDNDVLHMIDRGYFNFAKFETYCAERIRFVTLIKTNTIVNVIEELPIDLSSPITRHALGR
ncbi:hypothetical protein [Virgibacillus pantothenticus]|uniref:hypothetical protein n=1 Tax=Virgibacillus pantothenticus TaxID=1473 RepID=UPI00098584AB|nr:hypothetical protein [Virgibacillus pantothenticus]